MSALKPVDILSPRNICGEGILWDSRRELLWWTDIQGRQLYQYDFSNSAPRVLDTPERVGSFGLVAGSDRLITAFASGIALYDAFRGTVDWPVPMPSSRAFASTTVAWTGAGGSGAAPWLKTSSARRPAACIPSTAAARLAAMCAASASPTDCA
jgi:sugar lactone lactonase YvrE